MSSDTLAAALTELTPPECCPVMSQAALTWPDADSGVLGRRRGTRSVLLAEAAPSEPCAAESMLAGSDRAPVSATIRRSTPAVDGLAWGDRPSMLRRLHGRADEVRLD